MRLAGLLLITAITTLAGCGQAPVKPLMTEQEQQEWVVLNAKMQEHIKTAEPMKRVSIEDQRFNIENGKPAIRFSIKNDSNNALYQVNLRLEMWQGGVKPTLMEYLNIPINEGLLPNGVYKVGITPSNSQQWLQIKDLENADMKIYIERVLDKQKRPAYAVVQISKAERLRYLELKALSGE